MGEAGETSRYAALGPFAALPDHASLELRPFALTSVPRAPDGTLTPRVSLGGDLTWHRGPAWACCAPMVARSRSVPDARTMRWSPAGQMDRGAAPWHHLARAARLLVDDDNFDPIT